MISCFNYVEIQCKVLLIILIVVITYCVWSNLVGRLFNKFGWVFALVGVLLLLVFAVVLTVNRSNQQGSVSNELKNSQEELKKQNIDSERTTKSTSAIEKTVETNESEITTKSTSAIEKTVETNESEITTKSTSAIEKTVETNESEITTKSTSAIEKTVETNESEITPDSAMSVTKEEIKIPEHTTSSSNLNSSEEVKVEAGVEVGLDSGLINQDSVVLKLIEKSKEIVDQKPVLLSEDTLSSSNDLVTDNSQADNNIKIDIMRVDSQKEALVAGLAQPNIMVEVLADGQVIGSTKSDDQGEFVVMGTLGETAESQTLTVRSGTTPAVENRTDNKAGSGSVMVSGGDKQNESNDYLEWTLSDDIFIVLPSLSTHKSKTNLTLENIPLIVQSSSNDIKIIQKREQTLVSGITIDSISYSNLGEALLVGRGNPSNKALVYLDNKLISSSDVGALGGWSSELTGIAAGIYKLRIDEVNSAGEVQSRIATPFKKESKDFLLNMVSGSITVQTGNSLWRIARRIFGKGIRYIEIYEKNNNLIKDPNLIYPGQVFSIPTENYDS